MAPVAVHACVVVAFIVVAVVNATVILVQILPQREDMTATCVAVTEDFCIFGTSSGAIEYFYFADWTVLSGAEHRHEESIRDVFPNRTGVCVCMRACPRVCRAIR